MQTKDQHIIKNKKHLEGSMCLSKVCYQNYFRLKYKLQIELTKS